MQATLWLSPKTLRAKLSRSEAAQLERPFADYVQAGCRHLLALPVRTPKLPELAKHVAEFAVSSMEARFRFGFALLDVVGGDLARLREIVGAVAEVDIRDRATGLIDDDAIGCFELGVRVYAGALGGAVRLAKRLAATPLPAEHVPMFYGWVHLASCLDLCGTSLLVYLDEDRDRARASLVEHLCVLVKEFALSYGVTAMKFFPRKEPKPLRGTPLNARDRAWDRAWSRDVAAGIARVLEQY